MGLLYQEFSSEKSEWEAKLKQKEASLEVAGEKCEALEVKVKEMEDHLQQQIDSRDQGERERGVYVHHKQQQQNNSSKNNNNIKM